MRTNAAQNDPLNKAVMQWAAKRNITPAKLRDIADFDYSHAHMLIRGRLTVTPVTMARMINAFGPLSLAEVIDVYVSTVRGKAYEAMVHNGH